MNCKVNEIIKYNTNDKNSKGKAIHTFPTEFDDLKFIDQTLIVSTNKYVFCQSVWTLCEVSNTVDISSR